MSEADMVKDIFVLRDGVLVPARGYRFRLARFADGRVRVLFEKRVRLFKWVPLLNKDCIFTPTEVMKAVNEIRDFYGYSKECSR